MIIEELRKLFKNILSWICLLTGFSFFFFLFGLKQIEIFGRNIFLPLPSAQSFSSQIFAEVRRDLLPDGIHLIATNPLSAFSSQIMISLAMAFILTLPFFFYKIIGYFLPALFEKEKKVLIRALLPSFFLFFSGCAFAYFILIPAILRALYPFAEAMGAIPFFSISEFVTLVFGITLAAGLMFLLPVFMVLLSLSGLVGPKFWKDNWRYSFLIFLIFSAIITPDGTGITMIMLAAPLATLYFLGTLAATSKKVGNK